MERPIVFKVQKEEMKSPRQVKEFYIQIFLFCLQRNFFGDKVNRRQTANLLAKITRVYFMATSPIDDIIANSNLGENRENEHTQLSESIVEEAAKTGRKTMYIAMRTIR